MTYQKIYDIVCDFYKIDIKTKTRQRSYVYPKYIYFDLCKRYITNFNLSRCGGYIRVNHDNVIYGINKLNKELLKQDKELLKDYNFIDSLFINQSEIRLNFSYFNLNQELNQEIKKLKLTINNLKNEISIADYHPIFKEIDELNYETLQRFYEDRWKPFKRMNEC